MHTIARLAVVAATALAGGMSAPAISAQANVQANAQGERVIGNIIDSLIGTRYAVNDRYAIRRCGWAAVDKAERQYRPQFRGRHGFAYPGYHGYVRVTAITDVQRRLLNRVRVKGLLDTGRNGYGHGWRGADLTFRCDVDRHGRVDSVKIERNANYRPLRPQPR